MKRSRVSLAVCAAAAASLLACGDVAEDSSSVSEGATACSVVQNGGGWWNQSFTEQRGRFHVEFSATPSARNIDSVVGLGAGPASTWSSPAAIVRFNPQGYIDVRDATGYRYDHPYPYNDFVGLAYTFRIDVDLESRTYSVWLKTEHSSRYWSLLARDYRFRTEQANATRLDNVAAFTNPETSAPGGIQLCGFTVTRDATTADGCVISTAGSGFASVPVTATDGALVVTFSATPSQANMDGVVGVASGPVDAYNDFAASIRFWTNGAIEARDADVYRADVAVPYVAGELYEFKLVIDLATKTYSVYVFNSSWTDATLLARDYDFRPQQAGVAVLDQVATIIASTSGRLDTCRIANDSPVSLRYLRSGHFEALPLPGNAVLLSDGARTQRVDATGVTTGTISVGGRLAIDDTGCIYIARVFDGVLTVDSYTPALYYRWTRTANAAGDLGAIGFHQGVVMIGVGNVTERFAVDGTRQAPLPAQVAAIGPTTYVVVTRYVGAAAIEAYRADEPLWRRQFDGDFEVNAIAVGPDGSVVFGGEFSGTVNFGDREMTAWYPDGPRNPYIVALDPAGTLRFSQHLSGTNVVSIATNGQRIASSIYDLTQFPWVTMALHDITGNALGYWAEQGWGVGENGYPGSVKLSPSGRIFFNFDPMPYWTVNRATVPYFAAIDP